MTIRKTSGLKNLFALKRPDNGVVRISGLIEENTVTIGNDIEISFIKKAGRRMYIAVSAPKNLAVSRQDLVVKVLDENMVKVTCACGIVFPASKEERKRGWATHCSKTCPSLVVKKPTLGSRFIAGKKNKKIDPSELSTAEMLAKQYKLIKEMHQVIETIVCGPLSYYKTTYGAYGAKPDGTMGDPSDPEYGILQDLLKSEAIQDTDLYKELCR